MDKETLSNYGWIVICILVLSVMIALATPFGRYIETAVKNTTQGLFDVQQKAMGVAGLVVDDQSSEDISNKKIVNFGDSIIARGVPSSSISKYISNITGATTYAIGFGSSYMTQTNGSRQAFSMYEITNAITSKDFSMQETAISNNSSLPPYYSDNLTQLKAIDFNDIDIITISYGINDFYYNVKADSDTDKYDTSTYGGSLRYCIETIKAKYPHLQIAICTPTYAAWTIDGALVDTDSLRIGQGNTMADYIATAKEIGAEYGLLVIDNYNHSGICKDNTNACFDSGDIVHPNETGRKMIAENMAKELYKHFG